MIDRSIRRIREEMAGGLVLRSSFPQGPNKFSVVIASIPLMTDNTRNTKHETRDEFGQIFCSGPARARVDLYFFPYIK
jgi:hypothetical protein